MTARIRLCEPVLLISLIETIAAPHTTQYESIQPYYRPLIHRCLHDLMREKKTQPIFYIWYDVSFLAFVCFNHNVSYDRDVIEYNSIECVSQREVRNGISASIV